MHCCDEDEIFVNAVVMCFNAHAHSLYGGPCKLQGYPPKFLKGRCQGAVLHQGTCIKRGRPLKKANCSIKVRSF